MIELFIFRFLLVCAFIIGVYRFGDWKNLQSYYPTMLFVMVVNLSSCLLTYHHVLWGFGPDFFVTTSTVVELLNSYIALPATVFIFLSRFPSSGRLLQYAYFALWIFIFSTIELIDYTLGGISYQNGWSWRISTLFDFAIFSIVKIHHSKPFLAWSITFFLAAIILFLFDFHTAEMK